MKISQGTRSVLYGIHSPLHSISVTLAWKKHYGKWPELWELACIFLHDIGHIGTQYLDNIEEKNRHWKLGAEFAYYLFGQKGYELVAGHCSTSDTPKSRLYVPDKLSNITEPLIFSCWKCFIEPEIRNQNEGVIEHAKKWRELVTQSINSGNIIDSHELYLRYKKRDK